MDVLVAKGSNVEGGLSHMPDTRPPHVPPLRWLGQRDRGFAALRRATRTAIIMPAMFALGDKVIGNPQLATFAAFGSFAMLLLVDFGGTMAERLQAEAALAVTGGGFVFLATLASQTAWAAAAACRGLAARLRAGVAYLLSGMDEQFTLDRDHAVAQADQAVEALRSAFLATPYRPTGLSTPARTTVRLVDELIWLNSIVGQPGLHRDGVNRTALRVKQAAAAVLDRAADLLDSRGGSSGELDPALDAHAAAHARQRGGVTGGLPARSLRPAGDPAPGGPPLQPQPP